MAAGPCFQILICSILILSLYWERVEAQSAPCKSPYNKPGSCVAIERCQNIYSIVNNPTPPRKGIANYIKMAACILPGVQRSVCCLPEEIIPESSTTRSRSDLSSNLRLLPTNCGIRSRERIAYGDVTKVFDYPWMAVLRYDENGNIKDGCGGSLINERYILTAAHCLQNKSTMRLHSVVLGEHTKGQDQDCIIYYDENGEEEDRVCAGPTEVFGIESFVVHQDYNRPKRSNDIGLIRLNRDVTMKDHIRPICLPVTPELQRQAFGKYIVTGWGTTEKQTGSNILLEAILPHVDITDCQRIFNQNRLRVNLSDKQMCAGGRNRVDTCRGDSGGPLGFSVNYNGVRFVQFGIVSFGVGSCGKMSVPEIYCRVANYMNWIAEHIEP